MHSLTLKEILDRHGIKASEAEERLDVMLTALNDLPLEVLVMMIIGMVDNISLGLVSDKKQWFLSNISLNVNELLKLKEKGYVN